MESDNTGSLDAPELMLSQVFELPWDHGNAPVLTLKLATLMPMCSWNFKGSTN
jgi:hypothetical protein